MEELEYKIIKAKVAEFRAQEAKIKTLVKEYCQNLLAPLDLRWKMFVESKLGDHSTYIRRFKVLEDKGINYYDDFGIERYQDVDVDDLLVMCEEMADEDNGYNLTEEEVILFKEEALEKFIYSFEFDW